MWVFKTVGWLLLFLAALCCVLIVANWHTASLGGRDLKPLATPAVLCLILGIGVLFRRKSAALLVVVGCGLLSGWLVLGSLRSVPMPWVLFNVALGVTFLLPAVGIVAKRNVLVGW